MIKIGRKSIDKSDINSREKILEVATRLFAEKGFDGTRVDEIAAKAGVNKALIYYYFASKEIILEELFKTNIDNYIMQKDILAKQSTSLDVNNIDEYADKSLAALKEKDEIIKIAVIEALKSNKNDESLFKIMDTSFMSMMPRIKEMGLQLENETDSLITGFFFGFAPIIFSIILGDKWADYHGIDRDEFNTKFLNKLTDFYKKYASEFLVEGGK